MNQFNIRSCSSNVQHIFESNATCLNTISIDVLKLVIFQKQFSVCSRYGKSKFDCLSIVMVI